MFHEGRFIVDDKDYRILRCKISIPGATIDPQVGTVLGPPKVPSFKVEIESMQDTHLLRWIHKMLIKDHVQLRFNSVTLDSPARTFDLYDVRCVSNYDFFSKGGECPMVNKLTLIPGILVADGVLMRVQNWHIQNPDIIMGKIKPTVIGLPEKEKKEELDFIESYLTDMDDVRINGYHIGDQIKLVVNSENMVGESVTMNLKNRDADFEHNGQRLENDQLSNYLINSDTETIVLNVIEPERQN